MLTMDSGLVAKLETVFEDLVVEKGLVERPHIRSFTERCRNLKSAEKGKVLEIVQRYQKTVLDGKNRVSFIPGQLPLAAQRRLVEFSNSLPEAGKRERPLTLAPPPPAPPRP